MGRVEWHWNNVHEEKESPVDRRASFRRSAYKNELNEKTKSGGQTGTLQAICVQDRAEIKKKESKASGSACLRRPTDRIELCARINTTAQASTSNAFRALMEEPGNVVASTMRNITLFDGTKPENYRE